MLSDDALGSSREKATPFLSEQYLNTFKHILDDQNQELTVVEMNGTLVATFQLTFIQYLTHQGGLRASR